MSSVSRSLANTQPAGGDSGAWVIDNATNRVCAHVLAFSERNNTAYIAPMELLLDDISRTLKASVTLPTYPPAIEAKPTNAVATATGYPSPDTPPPSPPLATSPDPPCVRSLEHLSLVDVMAEQKLPDTDTLRNVAANYRPPQRSATVNKDMCIGGESSTTLKRRSAGIQAQG